MPSRSKDQLRAARFGIATAFDNIASAGDIFNLQRQIADEILASEPVYYADKSAPEKQHVQLLRIIGDGLAWRLLHPHTIRQLAKNQAAAISLTHQGEAFEQTMSAAKEAADDGIPAIVSDLTNCLRISDVVTCADPERPGLIECGGRVDQLSRGRKGRQMRRGLAIQQLLHKGEAQLPEDEGVSHTYETEEEANYSWDDVQACVAASLEKGFAVVEVEPGDVIIGIHQDMTMESVINQVEASTIKIKQGMVGHHQRKLAEPDPTVPPPLVWPLPLSTRILLLENDLELIHFIDLDRLDGTSPSTGVRVEFEGKGGELVKVEATVNENTYEVSQRFVTDILYGFQTISYVRALIDELVLHVNSSPIDELTSEPADAKNKVIEISTSDDARELLEKGAPSDVGYVSMPSDLLDEILREKRERSEP